MPRLILIQPAMGRKPGESFVRSWQLQPLAMARLAAMTPARWDVLFMDDRMERIDCDAKGDLVGISVEAYTARRGYAIAERFRARGVPVVLGGYQATLCSDDAAAHGDAVCVGEAEGVWEDILADAEHGRLRKIYRGDSSRPLRDLRCDRRVFEGKRYLPLALVETSRGCPFRCGFCSIAAFFKGSCRRRPVAEVVEELRGLGEKRVFFVDDNIVGDPAGARELFRAITPLGIRWLSQAGLHGLRDEGLIREMARSGCTGLLVGFESLEQGNLDAMGKGTNRLEEYGGTLARLRRAGILVYGTFVFGYPHDTPDSFDKAVRFAVRERLFLAAFNHLVPFPGTPLYARIEAEGRLKYPQWWLHDDFRFGQAPFRPAAMDAAELEARCLAARREYYSWGPMLRRSLDFRANSGSPGRAWLYWTLNMMLRREVSEKSGIPLGGPLP